VVIFLMMIKLNCSQKKISLPWLAYILGPTGPGVKQNTRYA